MSEQIHQNQNIPTEEEMRARDDAIFDTVAEFRNDLENPTPEVPEYQGIDADDAKSRVDVDTIFDNRKAEITGAGTGRRRKAYSEGAEAVAAKAGMQYRAARVAKQMAEGVGLQGLAKHRGDEEFAATAMAKEGKPDKGGKKGDKKEAPEAPEFIPELDSDEKESYVNPDALAAAEEAARKMPTRTGFDAEPKPESTPEPAPAEPQTSGGRHRGQRRSVLRAAPRVMLDGEIGAGYTGSIRVAGGESGTDSDDGRAIDPDGRLRIGTPVTGEGESSSEPVVVTPEARRRDRIVARLGKLVNTDQIRSELADAGAEIRESWRGVRESMRSSAGRYGNGALDLLYRKDTADLTDNERRMRPYIRTMSVAAGALAVTNAVLGIHNMSEGGGAQETSHRVGVSASPTPGESAKQFGPQVPKTSEAPAPSVSSSTAKETPKAKPTARPTTGPIASPSAIPHLPETWDAKPPVQEPKGPSTSAEQQQTKETDHDSISFTTKDGKVVRATATLKSGGSIFEAGHDAGLTDTEVANAVNKAGISNQRAEQLPVGQQINFDQQADGSYVVHLR